MSLATYTQEVPKLGYWHEKPTKSLNTAMGERYDERVHSRPVMVSESEPMSIQPTPGSVSASCMESSLHGREVGFDYWNLAVDEDDAFARNNTKQYLDQCRAMREAKASAGDAAVAKEAGETEHLSSTAKWESEVDKERNFRSQEELRDGPGELGDESEARVAFPVWFGCSRSFADENKKRCGVETFRGRSFELREANVTPHE
ncbi:hypothetical protein JHW43_000445 [Diplocarpon mali]|nr:hypothetical protein JHW43_000445 [Diplocarpon mali]